jgi:hypothetical protein
MKAAAKKKAQLPDDVRRPSSDPEARSRLARNPEQTRLSIDLPTSLHKRIKHRSTDERISMRDLVVEVLERAFS